MFCARHASYCSVFRCVHMCSNVNSISVEVGLSLSGRSHSNTAHRFTFTTHKLCAHEAKNSLRHDETRNVVQIFVYAIRTRCSRTLIEQRRFPHPKKRVSHLNIAFVRGGGGISAFFGSPDRTWDACAYLRAYIICKQHEKGLSQSAVSAGVCVYLTMQPGFIGCASR